MSFLDSLRDISTPDLPRKVELPRAASTPLPATRAAKDLCQAYLSLDDRLVSLGWHPTSEFWLEHILTFFQSGKRRFAARVGRRGGKTKTICRVVVTEILHGEYTVPPGDIGTFCIVSKDREDARDKINTIHQILDALRVKHVQTKDEIIFDDFPVRVKSYVATIQSVVGMTSIGLFLDEVSRWRDTATGANPAREVLASLRPSMKTMPNAHEYMISSPWAEDDVHYQTIEEGFTANQNVAIAATWIANPTPECSEEACRRDEPDDMIFQREYGAIPMPAGTSAFFDPKAIDASTTEEPIRPGDGGCVAGMDLGFSRDHAALAIARIDSDGVSRVVHLDEIAPDKKGLVFSAVLDRFIEALKRWGCTSVMGDSHHKAAAVEALNKAGVHFLQAPSPPVESYISVKRKFAEGRVLVPKSRRLRKQLLSINSCPVLGGKIRMILPRSADGHCDLASAFVLAVSQDWAYSAEKAEEGALSEEAAMYARSLALAKMFSAREDDGNYNEEDGVSYDN